jgi:hypothetical protein
MFVSTKICQMSIVSSYTVARMRQPNHLGCVRPMGRFGAHQAQNRPKTPPERPKKRIAGGEPQGLAQRGAPVWFDHKDPCGPPKSDGTLSAGAPRVGRCLLVALGRLHRHLAYFDQWKQTRSRARRDVAEAFLSRFRSWGVRCVVKIEYRVLNLVL